MKPKIQAVLDMCIRNGIELGYNRAHKHHDEPDESLIFMEIERAISDQIYEWFDFEETNYD